MSSLLSRGFTSLGAVMCWLVARIIAIVGSSSFTGPWGERGKYARGFGNGFTKIRLPQFSGNMRSYSIFLLLGILCAVWALSGLYVVEPDEEGVELWLGKYHATTMPGLHYCLPYPIGEVVNVSVTSIQRMEVGYKTVSNRQDAGGSDMDSLMLTKDENIVDTNFEIQWKIKDVREHLFNFRHADVNATVRSAAESIVREVIGRQEMLNLLEGRGRAMLADELQVSLQKLFDSYGMGIHITSIQVKKVDPPHAVIDAFRDVQSARADRERAINLAYAYSNDIIPRARGEAAAVINSAIAYKESVIHDATGESQRFTLAYNEYKVAKDVVKEKIYLDTMKDVFAGMGKVIVDKNASNVYYLPLAEMLKSREVK